MSNWLRIWCFPKQIIIFIEWKWARWAANRKKKYGMLKVRVTTVSVHSQRSADDSDDITVQDDFWEHSLMSEKAQCW